MRAALRTGGRSSSRAGGGHEDGWNEARASRGRRPRHRRKRDDPVDGRQQGAFIRGGRGRRRIMKVGIETFLCQRTGFCSRIAPRYFALADGPAAIVLQSDGCRVR